MIDRTFNENKLTLNALNECECLIFKHLIIDERTNFGKIDILVELYLPNKTNKMWIFSIKGIIKLETKPK